MWWGCTKSECTRIAAELSCDVTGPARAVSAQPAAGSTDMGEPAQVVARVIGQRAEGEVLEAGGRQHGSTRAWKEHE